MSVESAAPSGLLVLSGVVELSDTVIRLSLDDDVYYASCHLGLVGESDYGRFPGGSPDASTRPDGEFFGGLAGRLSAPRVVNAVRLADLGRGHGVELHDEGTGHLVLDVVLRRRLGRPDPGVGYHVMFDFGVPLRELSNSSFTVAPQVGPLTVTAVAKGKTPDVRVKGIFVGGRRVEIPFTTWPGDEIDVVVERVVSLAVDYGAAVPASEFAHLALIGVVGAAWRVRYSPDGLPADRMFESKHEHGEAP